MKIRVNSCDCYAICASLRRGKILIGLDNSIVAAVDRDLGAGGFSENGGG